MQLDVVGTELGMTEGQIAAVLQLVVQADSGGRVVRALRAIVVGTNGKLPGCSIGLDPGTRIAYKPAPVMNQWMLPDTTVRFF